MHSILLLMFCASLAIHASAQPIAPSTVSPTILMDAYAFRGSVGDPRARVDVYLSVPYQSLQFEAYNTSLAAQYTVHISIRDSVSRKIVDSSYTRSLVEDEYAITRGSTGKADNSTRTFSLHPGTYRIEVMVNDQFSRREYEQSRQLIVPDLLNTLPNISSIMYLKEIEQRDDRYRITPSVGDMVWSAESPLFAFVEVYTDSIPRSAGLSWQVTATDGRVLAKGLGQAFVCSLRTQQTFVPLALPARSAAGSYTLSVSLHPALVTSAGAADTTRRLPVPTGVVDTTRTLATRVRPYVIPRSLTTSILSDLDKAIKQLIYVAEQSDLDNIRSAVNDAERQQRFEEFWKRQDPTPSTIRNEAFEDYYGRIEAANKRFRSYSEGWLTDMGRVFIIYGEAMSVDRYSAQSGSALLVRWTYSNNTTFTFEDSTGFGDYRLRTPIPPGIRYKYRR